MGIKVPRENLVIQNARIVYRNFAGAEGQYNVKGNRNYGVVLDNLEEAQALEGLGWKVKYSKPREDGGEPDFPAHLPVTVKYHAKLQPPKVKMLTTRGMTNMDEESIDVLDYVSIANVDMILRPYYWKMPNGNEGVKNMCSSIYITVQEDALELKYANVPEIGPGDDMKAIGSNDVWDEPLQDLGEQEQRSIAGF